MADVQTRVILASIFLCTFAAPASASIFLGRVRTNQATAALSAETEHALLAELESALGSGHRHATEKRLLRLEQMMRPMHAAMSKNENGKLGPAAAGYMLHRIFVQRHGWFIKALEPEGNALAAWNSSSPMAMLDERLPKHVTQLFEARLGEHGLGLKELAIMAGTLEHLVHLESLQRLDLAYRSKGLSKDAELSEEDANEVLDIYMAVYILGFLYNDLGSLSTSKVTEIHNNILDIYPSWPETQQFLREVYASVKPSRDYLYFSEIENVVAEIGERYGRFQDNECRQLKETLVAKEDQGVGGAGRVRLADFYSMALHDGHWQFSESADYLRQLGALDESDASNLRVIIPNYISSPSNCVASSAYYSVCCLDECENILSQLEENIAEPATTPAAIAKLVQAIPSATTPVNRTLSNWLLSRLNEIATHHGGVVPMHGRLFAQWLHYAYPRECQFPHAAGTIKPQRPEDVLTVSGGIVDTSETVATEAMMRHHVDSAPPQSARAPGHEAHVEAESAMWTMDEELVVWRPIAEEQKGFASGGRMFAMLGAVLSLVTAMAKMWGPSSKSASLQSSSDKYFV